MDVKSIDEDAVQAWNTNGAGHLTGISDGTWDVGYALGEGLHIAVGQLVELEAFGD